MFFIFKINYAPSLVKMLQQAYNADGLLTSYLIPTGRYGL